MPTYEFRCETCQKTVTLVLSLEAFEEKDYRCPDCRSPQPEAANFNLPDQDLQEELI